MSDERPAPAKKATARKTAARKAPAKKATTKKTAAKKTAAKKATAKKATAKKTPAKKTAAKKAPAKKAAVATVADKTASPPRTTSKNRGKKPSAKKAAKKALTKRLNQTRARQRVARVVTSKFFKRATERAKKVVQDPEALKRVAEESLRSGAGRSGPFADVLDDFRTLIRLVIAYARGYYRDIPADRLVVVVAGLIYVVSPIDLIPDAIPGVGFLDDAAVIAWVVRSVRGELDEFRNWELGGGGATAR